MPAGGHGNTFGGSPLVCAAASAALDVLREERLAERARIEGEHLRQRLAGLASPLVREVRGKGLMLGVDLRTKSQPVLDALLRRRLLALAAGPTVVRLLPPLATPRDVLDGAVDALAGILADPALAPQASAAGAVEAA
jgi:acetylornithine/LysW-gamma-L-lysine aminotransferase